MDPENSLMRAHMNQYAVAEEITDTSILGHGTVPPSPSPSPTFVFPRRRRPARSPRPRTASTTTTSSAGPQAILNISHISLPLTCSWTSKVPLLIEVEQYCSTLIKSIVKRKRAVVRNLRGRPETSHSYHKKFLCWFAFGAKKEWH